MSLFRFSTYQANISPRIYSMFGNKEITYRVTATSIKEKREPVSEAEKETSANLERKTTTNRLHQTRFMNIKDRDSVQCVNRLIADLSSQLFQSCVVEL